MFRLGHSVSHSLGSFCRLAGDHFRRMPSMSSTGRIGTILRSATVCYLVFTRYSPQPFAMATTVSTAKRFSLFQTRLRIVGAPRYIVGARRMIVVLIGDGAAQARPMGPHVLTWTDLRKRSQKLEFPAGSETTCDLDKSRIAACE